MAFLAVQCRACGHEFFRVEVRCSSYPEAYACPMCESADTVKSVQAPATGQVPAESKPCCGGGSHSCGKSGGCGGCQK